MCKVNLVKVQGVIVKLLIIFFINHKNMQKQLFSK